MRRRVIRPAPRFGSLESANDYFRHRITTEEVRLSRAVPDDFSLVVDELKRDAPEAYATLTGLFTPKPKGAPLLLRHLVRLRGVIPDVTADENSISLIQTLCAIAQFEAMRQEEAAQLVVARFTRT